MIGNTGNNNCFSQWWLFFQGLCRACCKTLLTFRKLEKMTYAVFLVIGCEVFLSGNFILINRLSDHSADLMCKARIVLVRNLRTLFRDRYRGILRIIITDTCYNRLGQEAFLWCFCSFCKVIRQSMLYHKAQY